MSVFIRCLFGPRLFRLYRVGAQQGHEYQGNMLESFCDQLIKTAFLSMSIIWTFGFYTSPIIAGWMYKKGYFSTEYVYTFGRMSGAIGIMLFSAFCIRGLGRMMNSDYLKFIALFHDYKKSMNPSLKEELAYFDFDFREWSVDYRWDEHVRDTSVRQYLNTTTSSKSILEKVKDVPLSIASYFAIHSFGRRLIYPGSVKLIHALFSPVLLQGRAKLIEHYGGKRFKLLSMDNNQIDSLFVDRRNKENFPNGKTLVICCEGNSGFYEMGITLTPLEAGYSVLGWNHPGFFDSTGLPFPQQETNAIDVVMHFAVHKLGFKIENIVIYAWSIGGYTATWAAMNYPNIKGLVLDATFDDLVPLAVARMIPSLEKVVVKTIRDYMNLNNAEQVLRYNGPILLVRRTRDEMISTRPSRSIQTNRGNNLLLKLLQHRYPKLVTEKTVWALNEWLSGDKNHQTVLWAQQEVDETLCEESLRSYISEYSSEFPIQIGDGMPDDMKVPFVLYLADKYMIDFDSTHCVPLPPRLFRLPWDFSNITGSNRSGYCDKDSCAFKKT